MAEEQVDRAKLAVKVQKLLALAESEAKAGNEAARDTLIAKASALQLKYAIEDAMLSVGAQGKDEITHADFCAQSNTPLIKAKRQLIASLAGLNRGSAVMMGEWKPKKVGGMRYDRRAKVRVYAHQSDLDFITMLYNSLILQMQTMMAADERLMMPGFGQHASAKSKSVGSWRVSYAYAWVTRVVERLREAKHTSEAAAETGQPGTALVLRDRKQLVESHINQQHGKLKTTNYRRDDNSADGRHAGRQAAERADLGGTKVSASNTRAIEA